ncbi:MAG: aminopeptidase P family protein [Acidobacteriota bacterium]|nr:aminopeptidase P family protein [Acidobacteriota bacterium]
MNHSLRRRRAAKAAAEAGVEALLLTHLPDVRYLTGFTGSNGTVVLVGGKAALFTDGRYTTQAKEQTKGLKVVTVPKSAAAAAGAWLAEQGVKRCGVVAAHTTLAQLDGMRQALPAGLRRSFFKPVEPLVAKLREVKDADEVAILRKAAALGCRLFDPMLTLLQPGMTEVEVAAELEYAARRAGASGMSFDTIVASGVRSSLPHGTASLARLPRRGFVTLDFGVMVDGYCSDMTRTVHLGKATAAEREVYDSVLEAQLAAVAAVRPGVALGDVDEAARSVLRRAGLDKQFIHSTGHGVGLEIHEMPHVAAKQTAVLQEGMVITIEPGVYLAGRFGVRIEDMVLVTARGGETLTPTLKAWIEL